MNILISTHFAIDENPFSREVSRSKHSPKIVAGNGFRCIHKDCQRTRNVNSIYSICRLASFLNNECKSYKINYPLLWKE